MAKCAQKRLRSALVLLSITAVCVAPTVLTTGELDAFGRRVNWWSGNASVIWGNGSGAGEGFGFEVRWDPHWWPSPPSMTARREGGRVAAPVGVIAPICALILAMIVSSRRRITVGRCAHCGYDTTGCRSGSCPECGQPQQIADDRIHAIEGNPALRPNGTREGSRGCMSPKATETRG